MGQAEGRRSRVEDGEEVDEDGGGVEERDEEAAVLDRIFLKRGRSLSARKLSSHRLNRRDVQACVALVFSDRAN